MSRAAARLVLGSRAGSNGAPVVTACRDLRDQGWDNAQCSSMLAHGAASMAVAARLERDEWLSLCGQLFDRVRHLEVVEAAGSGMGLSLCRGGRS